MTDIAAAAGVNKVYYKDESSRFGLGSFKALGGSYAIECLSQDSPVVIWWSVLRPMVIMAVRSPGGRAYVVPNAMCLFTRMSVRRALKRSPRWGL